MVNSKKFEGGIGASLLTLLKVYETSGGMGKTFRTEKNRIGNFRELWCPAVV